MGKQQPTTRQTGRPALGRGLVRKTPALQPDRVVTESEAARILGYSKDTLRREFRAGRAPARVRLSAKRIGYRLSVLYAFLEARTEQPGVPK